MAVADRVRELASDKNMNIKDFSAFLDVSERTIQNYLAGISLPNGRFLSDLTEKIGASSTWVLNGIGPKYVSDKHQNLHIPHTDFITIPRLSVEASAGLGALVEDESHSGSYAFNRKWLERRRLKPDNLSVIAVRGDSMEPMLTDGDLILVDRAQREIADGLTYVVRVDTDLMVKMMQHLKHGVIALISANTFYPPREINLETEGDQIEIVGRVVASMQEW